MNATSYRHRPKPYGKEAIFTLHADRLGVEHGRRTGSFPFRDIAEINFLYAPYGPSMDGYRTKLTLRDGKTAAFTNLSWRSSVELERHDAEYRAFLYELTLRISKTNPRAVMWAGLSPLRYRITAIASLLGVLAMLGVVAYAIWRRYVPLPEVTPLYPTYLGVTAAGSLVYFLWWMRRYLTHNRPSPCTPGDIPERVQPRKPPAPLSR